MSRIFWDTNLFIYLLEDYGIHSQRALQLSRRMLQRGDELITSTLTLGEVLVKPREAGNDALANRFEELIVRNAELVMFDEKAARVYSQIRKDRTVKIADAIQLACAATANVDLFITNDESLSRRMVPAGVKFITLLERAPL